jgi:hypothetical protein
LSSAFAAQVDDFVDDVLEAALARALPVGAPDGAEGAVFGAAADGLHGGPHILVGLHEIPAGGEEFSAFEFAAFVNAAGCAGDTVAHDAAPGYVSVAFDDTVGSAALERLFGEERGVDSAVDDPRAALASQFADLIAAQGVAGMDADADYISGLNGGGVERFQGFIDEDGVAAGPWRGRGQNKEPARGDNRGSKGVVAGIDQVNVHRYVRLFSLRVQRICVSTYLCPLVNRKADVVDRSRGRRFSVILS